MFAKLPPLLQDYFEYFDTSPIMAVLLGVVIVVVGVALLRVALRLFLFFLLLLAIALVASYFIAGEERTNETLRRGAQEIGQQVDEGLEKGEKLLKDRYQEEK
jgi:membrane protein implicated in regulation of membrane protease activity